MAIGNPSFETAGASTGLAGSWTTSFVSSAEAYPDFSGGVGAQDPQEDFENGWDNDVYLFTFAGLDVTIGDFNSGLLTTQFDSFEAQWSGNESYLFTIGSATQGVFGALLATVEGFEVEWGNDDYLTTLSGADATDGVFANATGTDDYETGWGNAGYLTTLGGGDVTVGQFDGASAQAFEDFEQVSPTKTFTAVAGSATFTSAGHNFANTTRVRVRGPGIPGGLAAGIIFFIKNAGANDFELALTSGGTSIVASTDSLTGTATIFGDPSLYWNEVE